MKANQVNLSGEEYRKKIKNGKLFRR